MNYKIDKIDPAATGFQNRIIALTNWGKFHPWPSVGGLRHLVFFANTNGFQTAFKRVGRRILVDEAEFFRAVDKANQEGGE
jgi:hypothetical protein